MGYTHQYTQQRDFTDQEWSRLMMAFSRLCQEMPSSSRSAGGYYSNDPLAIDDQEGGEPVCVEERILFNGAPEPLSHETFLLTRFRERMDPDSPIPQGFRFCKTDRKPYDLMVCATLLMAAKVAPCVLEIRSDGTPEDWQPARDFVEHVFKVHPDLLEPPASPEA